MRINCFMQEAEMDGFDVTNKNATSLRRLSVSLLLCGKRGNHLDLSVDHVTFYLLMSASHIGLT
jgi:hypothetical protein